jgi:hypothetical protein
MRCSRSDRRVCQRCGAAPCHETPAVPVQRADAGSVGEGRGKIYCAYFSNDFAADKTRSLPEPDRKTYVAAYLGAGKNAGGMVVFCGVAADGTRLGRAIENEIDHAGAGNQQGEGLSGNFFAADEIAGERCGKCGAEDAGHWVMEERWKETRAALAKFL